MGDLVILYYVVCYSAGGAALIVSLVTAKSKASPWDGRFAAMAGSLALMLVPFAILDYLGQREETVLRFALWTLVVSGEALMVVFLPRFIHSLLPIPRARASETIWTVAAAASVLCVPVGVLARRAVFLLYVPMVAMPASIAYVVAIFLTRSRRSDAWDPRLGIRAVRRWKSMVKAITILSAAFLPLLVVTDFFPRIAYDLGLRLPPYFKSFPSLFAGISIAYLVRTLPLISSPAEDTPARETEAIIEAGLSSREAEVAQLLISGLRYREIAESLFISLSTVKTHVERIYKKTGARNKIDLARRLELMKAAE